MQHACRRLARGELGTERHGIGPEASVAGPPLCYGIETD